MVSRDRNNQRNSESGKASDPCGLLHDSQQDKKREDGSRCDERGKGQPLAEERISLIPSYDNCHPNAWNRINMDNQQQAEPNELSLSCQLSYEI